VIEALKKLRQALLTGVSHVIPFIASGGILIAFGIAFVPMTPTGPDFTDEPVLKLILDIGSAAFASIESSSETSPQDAEIPVGLGVQYCLG